MTRNQWIGAGCGGAGCLGLIVVVLAGGFIYWSYRKAPEPHNDNYNASRSSDQNSNTTNSAPGSSSSLSEDNRHKLFQAASATHDNELMKKVNKKLGLLDTDGTPNKKYAEFLKDHIVWIFRNTEWISEYNTPEKARAYVDEHIND
jgi:cytoskeletal protein RodZ